MTGLTIASLIAGAAGGIWNVGSGIYGASHTPSQNTGLMSSLNNEMAMMNAANTVENIKEDASELDAKQAAISGLTSLETARTAGGPMAQNKALAQGKTSEAFVNGFGSSYDKVAQNYRDRISNLQSQYNNASGIAKADYDSLLTQWKAGQGAAAGITNSANNLTKNLMNAALADAGNKSTTATAGGNSTTTATV